MDQETGRSDEAKEPTGKASEALEPPRRKAGTPKLVESRRVTDSRGVALRPIVLTAKPVEARLLAHPVTTVMGHGDRRGSPGPSVEQPSLTQSGAPISQTVFGDVIAPDPADATAAGDASEAGKATESVPAITYPVNGASFETAPITISGTAEPHSTVELVDWLSRAGVVHADDTGEWSITLLTLEEGAHHYRVRMLDAGNNASTFSRPCVLNVGANRADTPPSPSRLTDETSKTVLKVYIARARKLLSRTWSR